jgi:hypothetical protein
MVKRQTEFTPSVHRVVVFKKIASARSTGAPRGTDSDVFEKRPTSLSLHMPR